MNDERGWTRERANRTHRSLRQIKILALGWAGEQQTLPRAQNGCAATAAAAVVVVVVVLVVDAFLVDDKNQYIHITI